MRFPQDFCCVVTHLPQRTDRLPLVNKLAEQLKGVGRFTVNLAWNKDTNPYPKIKDEFHPTKWAVAASFRKSVQIAIESNLPYLIVAEDDAVLVKDVSAIQTCLNAAPDFDVLYCGHSRERQLDLAQPVTQVEGNVFWNTFLVMRRATATQLLQDMWTPDYWSSAPDGYGLLASDDSLSLWCGRNNIKRYVACPVIAIQQGGRGDNTHGNFQGWPAWYGR